MEDIIRNLRKERSATVQRYAGARVRYSAGRMGTVVDFSADLTRVIIKRDKRRGGERGMLTRRLRDPSLEFE